jgi:HEAT repeat protein
MTTSVPKTLPWRGWLSVGVGLALLLIALGYYATGPRHNGISAEKWLDEACRRSLRSRPSAIRGGVLSGAAQETLAFEGPVEAFRQMGNRGIDRLINAYVDQKPAGQGWYERLAGKVSRYVKLPVRASSASPLRSMVAYRLILRVGPSAIPEVIRWTPAADTETRVRLLRLLGEFGPGNPQSQVCLFQMLADPSPRVLYGALEALWMTEPEPTSAIPTVLPLLSHANARVREEAAYALGSLAPIPASLLQPLVKALSDTDGTVRANAARAVGLSGALSEDVFSALAGLLQDANPVTCFRAAEALVRLHGSDALCREPFLSQVISGAELSSNNYFCLIGFNGRTVLGTEGMGDSASVEMFRRLLSHPQAYFRTEALAGLKLRLERSACRIPTQIETLLRAAEHDQHGLVRFRARSIIERWGKPE